MCFVRSFVRERVPTTVTTTSTNLQPIGKPFNSTVLQIIFRLNCSLFDATATPPSDLRLIDGWMDGLIELLLIRRWIE